MSRINHLIITVLTAAAFICGSLLCSRSAEPLHALPEEGSLYLFCIGLAVIFIAFIVTSLLIRVAHPANTLLHTIAFSVFIAILIHSGIRLMVLNPLIPGMAFFSMETVPFFFGGYLVIFGVSMLSFLIKI